MALQASDQSAVKEKFERKLETVLRRQLPGCKSLLSVERLSGGASQETYRLLIEDHSSKAGQRLLAMRRAAGGLNLKKSELGYPGLAIEARLLQSAGAAGVPEPEIHYVLKPQDDLGDGFIMEWLEGETLGARIVRAAQFEAVRPTLAYACGKYMARIHNIDLQATGLRDQLTPLPPAECVQQTWARYRGFDTPQPMIDYTARWLLDHLPVGHETCLVHGDFRNGNLVLSEHGIVGVLDWELAHIGDPMRDLGWICTNSWRFGGAGPVGGFGEYADLFRGYAEESGHPVNPDHVRFWEVFGSFWWAVGCLGMAQQFRSGPDRTVERPAIGRRSSECQVDCVTLLLPGAVTLIPMPESGASEDLPRADELLTSVRDFLRNEVMAATQARLNFLARVAANSLDIVHRELALGATQRAQEHRRLQHFFASEEELDTLRWRLVHELREGSIELANETLQFHLRHTVVNQVAIDQPNYSGFKTAIHAT
ncbi:MAG: phosphotransferase family protein [Proteobacteria bacterium]|nr:phosphotransferase family protein [Pseudomonadota bacterium]